MFGDGESFRDFYLHQSQGQFLAKGGVSDWVKVPYNEARYGSNSIPEQRRLLELHQGLGQRLVRRAVKAGQVTGRDQDVR